jgi:hypothetical protein
MAEWCAARYVGADQAEAYGKRNAVEGELLVRVPLTKVKARKASPTGDARDERDGANGGATMPSQRRPREGLIVMKAP